jgi:hypothetical protein
MNQVWPVAEHLPRYLFRVVIVAKSEKWWKTEFDWKHLDGARTIKLMRLFRFDLLVKSVEQRI